MPPTWAAPPLRSLIVQGGLTIFAHGITRCHVTLTREQSKHNKGNRYSVMVEVRLPPQHDLAVKKHMEVVQTSELSDDTAPAYYNLARALEDKANGPQALEIYQRILTWNFDFQDVTIHKWTYADWCASGSMRSRMTPGS